MLDPVTNASYITALPDGVISARIDYLPDKVYLTLGSAPAFQNALVTTNYGAAIGYICEYEDWNSCGHNVFTFNTQASTYNPPGPVPPTFPGPPPFVTFPQEIITRVRAGDDCLCFASAFSDNGPEQMRFTFIGVPPPDGSPSLNITGFVTRDTHVCLPKIGYAWSSVFTFPFQAPYRMIISGCGAGMLVGLFDESQYQAAIIRNQTTVLSTNNFQNASILTGGGDSGSCLLADLFFLILVFWRTWPSYWHPNTNMRSMIIVCGHESDYIDISPEQPYTKGLCPVCWGFATKPGLRQRYIKMAIREASRPPSTTLPQPPKTKSSCCGGNKSIATTAAQAVKAFGSWAGQNFRKPTAEQLTERESICRSNICKKWDATNDSCLECGCWLKKVLPVVGDVGKRNHATQECPLKFWPAV